jgi:hypothetical protein
VAIQKSIVFLFYQRGYEHPISCRGSTWSASVKKTQKISGTHVRISDKALTVMDFTLNDHLITAETNWVSSEASAIYIVA